MALFKKAYVNVTSSTDLLIITHDVKRAVVEANLPFGIVQVFVPNSTSAVTLIENDPNLFNDIKKWIETSIPSTQDKRPERKSGTGKAFSHLRSQMFGCSVQIPIAENKLQIGNWQEVVFLDFDDKLTRREYFILVLGEAAAAK